jgi:two-component sensor histidine kinase
MKYAYPNGDGEILVRLWSEEEIVNMKVSDEGVGLPIDSDRDGAKSLGLTLVQALAEQLDGELEIGAGPGASFTICFARQTPQPLTFSVSA